MRHKATNAPNLKKFVNFFKLGIVVSPRKLFTNWTKVSLRTTYNWRIKFKRANEKHSSEQVLHFPSSFTPTKSHHSTGDSVPSKTPDFKFRYQRMNEIFRKLYPQSRSRKFAHAGSTIKELYLSIFNRLLFQHKCVIALKLQTFGSELSFLSIQSILQSQSQSHCQCVYYF